MDRNQLIYLVLCISIKRFFVSGPCAIWIDFKQPRFDGFYLVDSTMEYQYGVQSFTSETMNIKEYVEFHMYIGSIFCKSIDFE